MCSHTGPVLDVSLVLQAEVQTKVATIDKQKNNVAVAQRLSKAFNPQKMKIDDIVAQHDQRQRRLEELSKRHPELQQVFLQTAVCTFLGRHCLCEQRCVVRCIRLLWTKLVACISMHRHMLLWRPAAHSRQSNWPMHSCRSSSLAKKPQLLEQATAIYRSSKRYAISFRQSSGCKQPILCDHMPTLLPVLVAPG